MIEDIKILEAVEQYIRGEMSADDRVYFEQLRKTNPEIDQLVVEHTVFLQQLNRFDETRNLRSVLNEVHADLSAQGEIIIATPKPQGRLRYLVNRYKKTVAIAACIAGVTAVSISVLISTFSASSAAKQEDLVKLKGYFDDKVENIVKKNKDIEKQTTAIENKINSVPDAQTTAIHYTTGTAFLIDAKGYVVTNAHVLEEARNIALRGRDGKDLSAQIVYIDNYRDLAILKITGSGFKPFASLPYSIKKGIPDLAEEVFTLGYPRSEIVYGEGYIAARTGYQGDSLALQLTIAANNGNSGGPVLNKNGEVIGILSAKQKSAEGAVFALHSKYIYNAILELQKDTSYRNVKLPTTSSLKGLDKSQQVKRIEDCVFMVKVN